MTSTERTGRQRTGQLLMAFVGAAAFFASAPGQSFLIAVFVDEMLRGTGLDRTTYSGLCAPGTVVSAVVMLVLGKVIDRRGVRVAWVAVTVGLALSCGLASVATGASSCSERARYCVPSGKARFRCLARCLARCLSPARSSGAEVRRWRSRTSV